MPIAKTRILTEPASYCFVSFFLVLFFFFFSQGHPESPTIDAPGFQPMLRRR